MQSDRFVDLEQRAAISQELDAIKKLETRARVHQEIEAMKAEGKAMELSTEEEDLLYAFRRFKLRLRKDGEVFKWQTRKPEGVQIIQETAEVVAPAEAVTATNL